MLQKGQRCRTPTNPWYIVCVFHCWVKKLDIVHCTGCGKTQQKKHRPCMTMFDDCVCAQCVDSFCSVAMLCPCVLQCILACQGLWVNMAWHSLCVTGMSLSQPSMPHMHCKSTATLSLLRLLPCMHSNHRSLAQDSSPSTKTNFRAKHLRLFSMFQRTRTPQLKRNCDSNLFTLAWKIAK